MTDDLKNSGPQDRARVNVNEEHEVRYWCKELACSEMELRSAVRVAGPSAEAVRAHLNR